jgi:hypothetical protein
MDVEEGGAAAAAGGAADGFGAKRKKKKKKSKGGKQRRLYSRDGRHARCGWSAAPAPKVPAPTLTAT